MTTTNDPEKVRRYFERIEASRNPMEIDSIMKDVQNDPFLVGETRADVIVSASERKNAIMAIVPRDTQDEEGGITLATPQESKVLVEDLGRRYNAPPGFILAFKDRKTGRMTAYFTRNFYGLVLERKGYAHLGCKPGPKHDPAHHIYHYIFELDPAVSKDAIEMLKVLKDAVSGEEFLKEYRRLTAPIQEEGYASPDTVRMRTMRTDYNLDRLARTRGYRHIAALYTGVGLPSQAEDEVDEVVEARTINVTPEMADEVLGRGN